MAKAEAYEQVLEGLKALKSIGITHFAGVAMPDKSEMKVLALRKSGMNVRQIAKLREAFVDAGMDRRQAAARANRQSVLIRRAIGKQIKTGHQPLCVEV